MNSGISVLILIIDFNIVFFETSKKIKKEEWKLKSMKKLTLQRWKMKIVKFYKNLEARNKVIETILTQKSRYLNYFELLLMSRCDDKLEEFLVY